MSDHSEALAGPDGSTPIPASRVLCYIDRFYEFTEAVIRKAPRSSWSHPNLMGDETQFSAEFALYHGAVGLRETLDFESDQTPQLPLSHGWSPGAERLLRRSMRTARGLVCEGWGWTLDQSRLAELERDVRARDDLMEDLDSQRAAAFVTWSKAKEEARQRLADRRDAERPGWRDEGLNLAGAEEAARYEESESRPQFEEMRRIEAEVEAVRRGPLVGDRPAAMTEYEVKELAEIARDLDRLRETAEPIATREYEAATEGYEAGKAAFDSFLAARAEAQGDPGGTPAGHASVGDNGYIYSSQNAYAYAINLESHHTGLMKEHKSNGILKECKKVGGRYRYRVDDARSEKTHAEIKAKVAEFDRLKKENRRSGARKREQNRREP